MLRINFHSTGLEHTARSTLRARDVSRHAWTSPGATGSALVSGLHLGILRKRSAYAGFSSPPHTRATSRTSSNAGGDIVAFWCFRLHGKGGLATSCAIGERAATSMMRGAAPFLTTLMSSWRWRRLGAGAGGTSSTPSA